MIVDHEPSPSQWEIERYFDLAKLSRNKRVAFSLGFRAGYQRGARAPQYHAIKPMLDAQTREHQRANVYEQELREANERIGRMREYIGRLQNMHPIILTRDDLDY